jgi:hypothetical protein
VITGRQGFLAVLLMLTGLIVNAQAKATSPAPAWDITSQAVPTNFVPGDESGTYAYVVNATNIGAAATDGTPITLTDTLPSGLTVKSIELRLHSIKTSEGVFDYGSEPGACETESSGGGEIVRCTVSEALPESKEPAVVGPSETLRMVIHVFTSPTVPQGETLTNLVQVQGGNAPTATTTNHNETALEGGGGQPLPAPAGFSYYRSLLLGLNGESVGQAASHPYEYTTSFAVNTKATPPGTRAPFVPSGGDLKDIRVELPPGFVGSPTAVSRCTAQQFTTPSPESSLEHPTNECPDGSAVGLLVVQQLEGSFEGLFPVPIYNLVPPKGMPAQLGFQILNAPFYIDTEVRTDGDYGINAWLRNSSEVQRVTAASVTLWGTPADPRHNPLRGSCVNSAGTLPIFSNGSCPAGLTPRPFLRLPTSCQEPLDISMSFDTWTTPGTFVSESSGTPAPSGCALPPFGPTISVIPTTTVADSPSGLSFNLHLPQSEDPDQLATADLRDLAVTLPNGVSVNPASAGGLVGCSLAQLELHGPEPARCPDAAKIGTVEVHTPLLDHPIDGAVYVASQDENPFGSLLAIYVTAFDQATGVVLKLAGRVEPDPSTGQLKTTFTNNPQLPFEDLTTRFFEGPRAPLRTPLTCGRYTTTTDMRPWSAPDSGPDATPSDSFDVGTAPGGGPCASSEAAAANSPSFQAGTITPIAGSYSPFVMNLGRSDGSQYVHGLEVTLPPGLVGKLAGIPYCPEASLGAAAERSGKAEQASPSCPAASQVGSVSVGAGAGPSPIHVAGKAYLAGPYEGAPLSLAVITPAVAGPFDLGDVVVRAALRIDPDTAQVTAVSDPLPAILRGIPLDLRSVSLDVDKPDFTLNPTSCEPKAVSGVEISLANQAAPLSSRFQVGACGALGFRPKLGLHLSGRASRGAHPRLRAVLRMPPGSANIARASVKLPHSEFLDQAHIRTVCTRVQFVANGCPAGSIYGRVVATSPLIGYPLEGPVYLRSSSHELPDLVMALHGPASQPIEVDAVGRIDSIHGDIRTTFESIPDVPVSKLVLDMQGGKRGLLVNSRDICASTNRATVKFDAQNGKIHDFNPVLRGSCNKG